MEVNWLLVLVALVATASAQTTMLMPEASPAPMPDTPTTVPPVTTEEAMPTTPPAPAEPGSLAERYAAADAMETRRDHFYCLGPNQTRADIQPTDSNNQLSYRWGLWIQYPVLSYLDSMRKRHLFYVISRMTDPSIFDNEICVAEVEQYGVSTYRESVFVKLYLRNNNDLSTLQRLNDAFRGNYSRPSTYTVSYLGQTALNIIATEPPGTVVLSNAQVKDNVHPGCDLENCPEGDPTLLAVVVGTYVGSWYTTRYQGAEPVDIAVEDIEAGRVPEFMSLANFVENPRPINYGLEAGDIVFAVFGSIFLTILCGAIVLGFFIHPFYLS